MKENIETNKIVPELNQEITDTLLTKTIMSPPYGPHWRQGEYVNKEAELGKDDSMDIPI